MKKILGLVLLLGFSSCSNAPRKPSSIIFTCHFKEKIGETVKNFEFVPDDHALLIDNFDIAMEESDFASGAFIYRSAKKEKDWKIELVFSSYEQRPQVYLKLQKSPLSTTSMSYVKECE